MPEFAMKLAVLSLKGNEGYLPLADDLCFQTSLETFFKEEVGGGKEVGGLSV